MIWRPKPGQRVELHYKESMRAVCPHLEKGIVIKSGGRKIVNALVKLDDGKMLIVPRGNLQETKA